MSKVYVGLALADSMFNGDVMVARKELNVDEVRLVVESGAISCCNPSHALSLTALKMRYGIEVSVPVTAPKVSLNEGDAILVLGIRGLPRMTDRHEYTTDEVEKATFVFSLWIVQSELFS